MNQIPKRIGNVPEVIAVADPEQRSSLDNESAASLAAFDSRSKSERPRHGRIGSLNQGA